MTEPTEWRTAEGARVKGDAVPTVVQQRNVPEAICFLSTLESPDYVDVFTVASAVTDKSPEQWARATVEGVSPWARFVVWRVLCGLRLRPQPSPDSLAGWHVAFATFVRYDRPMAALVWPALSIGHRRAVPDLLRYAVKRINRSRC